MLYETRSHLELLSYTEVVQNSPLCDRWSDLDSLDALFISVSTHHDTSTLPLQ